MMQTAPELLGTQYSTSIPVPGGCFRDPHETHPNSFGSEDLEARLGALTSFRVQELVGKIEPLALEAERTAPLAAPRIARAILWIKTALLNHDTLLVGKRTLEGGWVEIQKGTLISTSNSSQPLPFSIRYRQSLLGPLNVEAPLSKLGNGGTKLFLEVLSVNGIAAQRLAKAYPAEGVSRKAFQTSMEYELYVQAQLKKCGVSYIAYTTKVLSPDPQETTDQLEYEVGYVMPPCVQSLYTYWFSSWKDLNPTNEYFNNCGYITYYLILSLSQIHAARWFHGDLKPANILLQQEGKFPLVTDFGFSGKIGEKVPWRPTIGYIAPELLKGNKITNDVDGAALDMWQVGVILYELFFHKNPFEEHQRHIYEIIASTGTIPKKWKENFDEGIDTARKQMHLPHLQNYPIAGLIYDLLNPEPKDRTTAKSALTILGSALGIQPPSAAKELREPTVQHPHVRKDRPVSGERLTPWTDRDLPSLPTEEERASIKPKTPQPPLPLDDQKPRTPWAKQTLPTPPPPPKRQKLGKTEE